LNPGTTTEAQPAAEAPVGLGTAGTYSVLGGQTVTNIGHSIIARAVLVGLDHAVREMKVLLN